MALGGIMLKVDQVSKYYGDFLAVDHLSFEVKEGEIFGLLGVNGAGKTTTFRMIMGLLSPSSGEITLNGKKIDYDVTDKIGFLTEERSLLTKMTVKEQCLFYGALKGMTEEAVLAKMEALLQKFRIEEYKEKKIKELSKGNQQKVQFITAILNDPKLLILDEPFSGLDPFNVELFKNVIIELAEQGSMIIFSSHRMEHVELFCKKLTVLLKGKPVLQGDLKQIKKEYRKKNIRIKGEIDNTLFQDIKGICSVTPIGDEYEIKVEAEEVVDSIFKLLKAEKHHITKFVVEEPSLNEIFITKVGENYEK